MLRKIVLVTIVAVGTVAIVFVIAGRKPFYHHLKLKSCFDNVHGLRAGGSVQIAGVDVGSVRSVRVDPNLKNCPATVDMEIATPYELKIPKDSVAVVKTEGMLGASAIDIDISHATASPIENYGYLNSRASPDPIDEFKKFLDGFDKHITESMEVEREHKAAGSSAHLKP